jgi:uncharacterized protein YlxW (UPF0749 family)
MKNMKSQLLLGLTFVFLGILLSYQFKSYYKIFTINKNRNISSIVIVNEVETLKKQRVESLAILEKYKNSIDTYENNSSRTNKNIKVLKDKIDKLKLTSGLTNVKGQGVIIKVEPTTDIDGWVEPFRSEDIVSMVNDLNSAGAEAIAINEQRYTSMTLVKDVSNNILINGYKYNRTKAFSFKAIGNPEVLTQVIELPNNSVDILKKLGFDIQISKESNVEILKN